jgi:hypothetical protein
MRTNEISSKSRESERRRMTWTGACCVDNARDSPSPVHCRKYVQELDAKFQREEERRQAEVARKASSNSTDRSAFLLAQVVLHPPLLTLSPLFSESRGGVQAQAG